MPLEPPRPRLLLLRAPATAGPTLSALKAQGWEGRAHAPLAEAPASPEAQAELLAALRQWARLDAVVFTSARAVASLAEAWAGLHPGPPPAGPRLAAVGPATAQAVLARLERPADLVGAQAEALALAEGLGTALGRPGRLLWPHNEAADPAFYHALLAQGHQVLAPVAYRMRPTELAPLAAALAWAQGVVGYSPEGWRVACEAWLAHGAPGQAPPWGVAIGPATAKAMAKGLGEFRGQVPRPEVGAVVAALAMALRA